MCPWGVNTPAAEPRAQIDLAGCCGHVLVWRQTGPSEPVCIPAHSTGGAVPAPSDSTCVSDDLEISSDTHPEPSFLPFFFHSLPLTF